MVPEGWSKPKLGEVAQLQRGFDLPSHARIDGEVPIISSGGLCGFHNQSKAKAPGVVTGRYGSIGEVFYVECDYWPLNTALWVKNFYGNNPKYIYYLLSKIDYKKFSDKTGVPGVNRNDLHAIKVPLAPRAEQDRITQILTAWDNAIETVEKLIENSRTQKNAVIQQLFMGRNRFKHFVHSFEKTKTKYGEISKDWQFVHIEQIANQVSVRNTNNNSYPVLSCTKYEGFVDSLKYFKKKVFSDDTSTYKVVPRNTFAFPSNHIEEGSIGYQDLYGFGLVSPIYTVFKTKDTVHDGYLYKLLKTEHYRQIFSAQTNASVDRRGSLRWNEFKKIQVPLPSFEEQETISNTIDAADNELKNYQQQLENLQRQKKSLMQQLLTGKRRVKLDQA